MTWKLKTNDFKESAISAAVLGCEKKKIFFLSIKKLVLFWSIAALCIFIPLLHFILVPAFFGLGIFSFLSQYKNKFYLAKADCQCPQCQKHFTLENFYFFDGKKLGCTNCMAQLRIEQD